MSRTRIAVLVSGGGTNLQTIIDEIENSNINGEIGIVISDREGVFALERAKKHGIKAVVIKKNELKEKLLKTIRAENIQLVVLAGFLSILGEDVVNVYRNAIINVHPSLIPAFCGDGFYGYRVHEAVISYGVKVSGATVHFVDEGTDSGPVILQDTIRVDGQDTAETLAAKVLKVEHRLLPEAVKLFCDGKLRIEGRKVQIADNR